MAEEKSSSLLEGCRYDLRTIGNDSDNESCVYRVASINKIVIINKKNIIVRLFLKKLEKRLKRQQRRLQKHYNKYLTISLHTKTKYEDIPKSKNMEKLLHARFKTIEKIKHKTTNDINCATKSIVEQYPSDIVIESISSQDQIKNHKWISKYAPYMLYYEIHRQLIYKSEDRGIIIKADKEFPSSQICSNCGDIHKVYGNSIYKCPKCGFRTDRDLNAAYNLRNLAYLK